MRLPGPTFLLFLALSAGALAQQSAPGQSQAPVPPAPTVEREIKGRAGRDIRILVVTNVLPDCTSGPLPTVRLVTPPAHGKIVVRRAKLNATNVRQCLAITVPALVGIYRSAPDFQGSDSAVVEIRPEGGAPRLQRLNISVTKADERSI